MNNAGRIAKTLIDDTQLAKRLEDVFITRSGGKRRRDVSINTGSRVDVVSGRLCDDTIEYLAPTLEQHKGCTIIDIHPGPCLWSSKIHDFLKPKRHILMEPEVKYFDPFIKPLLEKSCSAYVYTPLAGAHPISYWHSYVKLVEDGMLTLSASESRQHDLNTSILVIGNLARHYRVVRGPNKVAWQRMVLKQLTAASSTGDLFHKAGPVRMLLWTPEADRRLIIPRSAFSRSPFNFSFPLFSSITEAVGISAVGAATEPNKHPYSSAIRYGGIEMASAKLVRARSQSSLLPTDRTLLSPANLPSGDRKATIRSPFDNLPKTISGIDAYLQATQKRFDVANDMMPYIGSSKAFTERVEKFLSTMMEFPQSLPAVKAHAYAISGNSVEKLAMFVDLTFSIIRLEASVNQAEADGVDGDALAKLKTRIMELGEAVKAVSQARMSVFEKSMDSIVDDHMAFFITPPLCAIDRRRYEPLQAETQEFWPPKPLVLLDIVPTKRDLAVPDVADQSEGVKVCQELMKVLFANRSSLLPAALDRLAPNAAQDLIPQVPAFTDARKGGRLNPDNVRVRMLTDEMIQALTKTFLEWPFRPSTLELELEGVGSEQVESPSEEGAQVDK